MAQLPERLNVTTSRIYQHYEDNQEDGRRPHLGASLIGRPCARQLWYIFHWATRRKHSGRLLRLFRYGIDAEPRFVAELRAIGIEVMDRAPDGAQWRVSDLGGHFGGSMDGAGVGFVEAPKTWHVLEFKTHNDKSFTDLQKDGVKKSKPEHYAQMQVYMGLTGMDRAFYMAENKNNSELHTERVEFDPVEFQKLRAKAERILDAAEPPEGISRDPSFYVCKMCDHRDVCHGNKAPAVSCRTCAHSTVRKDGDALWTCEQFGEIGYIAQLESDKCPSHRYIPILLHRAGSFQAGTDTGGVRYNGDKGLFVNGSAEGEITSNEIAAMDDITMLADAYRMKQDLAKQGIDSRVIR